MPVKRLNHAVLYVRDATESAKFYSQALGFRTVMTDSSGRAIFLQAPASNNDHDLGLFSIGDQAADSSAGRSSVGLYHLAWEVDTLAELERVAGELSSRGALVGTSNHGTTKSVYGKDPDGIEFEIAWIVPADLLDEEAVQSKARITRLDIEKEKARYGSNTEGGVGISSPQAQA